MTTARARWRSLLPAVLAGAQLWLAASTAYLLALLIGGRRPGAAIGGADPESWPSMLVLVPAHDEEEGIASCVEALVTQDYQGDCTVVVVADNCTDATATVARRAGATVLVRTDTQARGKGPALNWALGRLQGGSEEIVVFVDADCIASPNLCLEAARALSTPGVSVVQARYEVSNPEASPTSALRAAGFLLKHVIQPRGRQRFGLSCGLFGSGMAFRRSVLRELEWPTSVTEDAEMHLVLVRRGITVRYLEPAAVSSPMPLTGTQAAEQQLRWETGNAEMRRRHARRLIVEGMSSGRPAPIASALELFIPPQSLLVGASVSLATAAAVVRRPRLAALGAVTAAADAIYVIAGLVWSDAPPEAFRALLLAPAFVARRLGVLGRVMSGRRAQEWVRTDR